MSDDELAHQLSCIERCHEMSRRMLGLDQLLEGGNVVSFSKAKRRRELVQRGGSIFNPLTKLAAALDDIF